MSVKLLKNEVGERRYVLFLLFLVSVLSYVDRTILSILQVPIKADLGLSDSQLGALTGLSFALFYATLAVPLARLADRTVRKRLVAAALATWSAMTALTGLAGNFASLVFFRIGVAAGEAGSIPASQSMIADIYPPDSRATAFAFWGLSLPAGLLLGYAGAGALEHAFGWRATFAVIGGAGLVLAPIVLWTLREPTRGRYDPVAAPAEAISTMQSLRCLWSSRSLRYLFAAGALHTFTWCAANSWNAPFYVRVHGMPLAEVARDLALMNGFGSAIGMYLGGRLSDYFGARNPSGRLWVVSAALLLLVPFALGQYLVQSAALSIALGAVTSVLMLVYYAPIVAVTQLQVPASMRAFAAAVLLLVTNLFGLGLGPLATGFVSDILVARYGMEADSLRYALSLAILLSWGAAWLFWRASSRLQREMPVPRMILASTD
jgi:predicted MFS family arabinose efflux permease